MEGLLKNVPLSNIANKKKPEDSKNEEESVLENPNDQNSIINKKPNNNNSIGLRDNDNSLYKNISNKRNNKLMKKSVISAINKVDRMISDVDTARKHGEAKRLMQIDQENLKNSKGILFFLECLKILKRLKL